MHRRTGIIPLEANPGSPTQRVFQLHDFTADDIKLGRQRRAREALIANLTGVGLPGFESSPLLRAMAATKAAPLLLPRLDRDLNLWRTENHNHFHRRR